MMIMTKTKFWKQISILSILFIIWGLFLVSGASADINWATSANNATIVETARSGGPTNTINKIIDGDINSYYKLYRIDNEANHDWAIVTTSVEITFAQPLTILNEIKYKWYRNSGCAGMEEGHRRNVIISIKKDGLWSQIGTSTAEQVTIPGPWDNVTDVRGYFEEMRKVAHGTVWAELRIYEIEAWGFIYQDIGLRVYNGSETIAIAAEPTGTLTSPLRIAKNGVIYGIVLVDPGDTNDSGVRIQTSSGIKALRKYP